MNDLTKEKGRRELKLFFENLLDFVDERLASGKLFNSVSKSALNI